MAYQIDIKDNVLILRTTSFKAEKGSVLHSGIYNRELASSLVAGALIMLSGFFFTINFKITTIHFIIAIVLFAALFLIFRIYIFREPFLEVVFDKGRKSITISLKRIIGKRKESHFMGELAGIKQNHVSVSPENPDGIKVVEKIALQHGTVIPGFGETVELYTVELEFKDRKRVMVFSSKETSEADDITTKLKDFIER